MRRGVGEVVQQIVRHLGAQELRDAGLVPEADVDALVDLAMERDIEGARGFIEGRMEAGRRMSWILGELIPTVARRIGQYWLDDDWSFVQVTWGVGTLQLLLRQLSEAEAPTRSVRSLVLLSSPPEEQHTLGIFVLGEMLRRESWSVDVQPGLDVDELSARVAAERVAAVGLSVSNGELFPLVRPMVDQLKQASAHPELAVLIGGAPDLEVPAHQAGAVYCGNARATAAWLAENVAPHRFRDA